MKFRLLDLFSGIGGFSLGLERSGYFETVQFCEIEEFPRRVLAKHWPKVPCHDDIRNLDRSRLVPRIDAICGGFPCQDISIAGKGKGIDGERSGLWSDYSRIVRDIKPRWVVVENVSNLLGRGLDRVLRDLAASGYGIWWDCIPASAMRAPHIRDRIWIVAYAQHSNADSAGSYREEKYNGSIQPGNRESGYAESICADVSYANGGGRNRWTGKIEKANGRRQSSNSCDHVPDSNSAGRFEQWWPVAIREELSAIERGSRWPVEPGICRMAYGVPDRVDRIIGLGNAVVPQIPELIGRLIGRFETECNGLHF